MPTLKSGSMTWTSPSKMKKSDTNRYHGPGEIRGLFSFLAKEEGGSNGGNSER